MKIQFGKQLRSINEKDLFAVDVIPSWIDIPFDVVCKYPDFTNELCKQFNLESVDKQSYGLAVDYAVELKDANETIEEEETIMADAVVTNVTTTNTEEEVIMTQETMQKKMVDENGNLSVEGIKEVLTNIAEGASNIATNAKDDVAPHVEQVKGYLVSLSGILDVLGLTKLKLDYDRIIYAGLNENGNPTKWDAMTEELTNICREEIKRLEYFSTEKRIAQAFALKTMIGTVEVNKNIFECIIGGLLNVIRRATDFIKDKYKLAEDKAKSTVVKAILKGIRSIFCALIQGATVIIKLAGHAVSFVICGVVAISYWAFNTIKKLIKRLGEFIASKCNKEEDFAEEDFFANEETVVAEQ